MTDDPETLMHYALVYLAHKLGLSDDELKEGALQLYYRDFPEDHPPPELTAEAPPAPTTPSDADDEPPPEPTWPDLSEPRTIILTGPARAYRADYEAFIDAGGHINSAGHRLDLEDGPPKTPTPPTPDAPKADN